jgi:hypothetical protein
MTTATATRGVRSKVEVVEHAVLRAAAWPIETVDQFAAPGLAEAATAVLAARCRVVAQRDAAVAKLHSAVSCQPDREVRRYLLAAKRAIYSGTGVLPQPSQYVQAAIAAHDSLSPLLSVTDRARQELDSRRNVFVRLHAIEMERQRRALRRETSVERFRKALVIANPLVASRWETACEQLLAEEQQADSDSKGSSRGTVDDAVATSQQSPAGGRRSRRLEATVFHYLMRAAGRATPCDAWAGVAPVELDPHDATTEPRLTLSSSESRCEVSVDLRPFQIMLRALGRTERYRHTYPIRLNPTLFAASDRADGRHDVPGRSISAVDPDAAPTAGWRYERQFQGVANWVTLPFHPLPAAVIRHFADHVSRPAASLNEAMRGQADEDVLQRDTFACLIDTLIDWDVLRVDLAMPSRASSVWDALDTAAVGLLEPERSTWQDAIRGLRTRCERLGREFDRLSPEEVKRYRRAIVADVQNLWEMTGLVGEPSPPVVHLDMRLPFTARWNSSLRALTEQTVNDLLEFHARDGGAELYRRQSLHDVVTACAGAAEVPMLQLLAGGELRWRVGPGPVVGAQDADPADWPHTRETILSRAPADTPMARQAALHCRRWQDLLDPVHHLPLYRVPISLSREASATCTDALADPPALPGPYGSVLLRWGGGERIWIGAARPEPGLHVARFAGLLREVDGDEVGALFALLRDKLTSAGTAVTLAEIVGDDALNPNVDLHPRLTASIVDSHGSPASGLQNLTLLLDRADLRPWLRRSPGSDRVLPVSNSGAHMGYTDRCSRLLLTVARGHGWEFLSFGFPPSRAELARWHHLPRLLLPEGGVLSPQRWTLDRPTLSKLMAETGPDQFLLWRQEVERLGVPALVHARCGPATSELMLRTDSPLAVSCLLDSIGKDAPWMTLSEIAESSFAWAIQDPTGDHYVAELAVVWFADDYWNAVTPPWAGDHEHA